LGKRSPATRSIITGVVLLAAGVAMLSSLLTYHREDMGLLSHGEGNVANAFGSVGARVAHFFYSHLGFVFPWFIAALLLAWSWNRLARRTPGRLWLETAFTLLLAFVFSLGLGLLPWFSREASEAAAGRLGLDVIDSGRTVFGNFGATVVCWSFFVVLTFVAVETALIPGTKYLGLLSRLGALLKRWVLFAREKSQQKMAERSTPEVKASRPAAGPRPEKVSDKPEARPKEAVKPKIVTQPGGALRVSEKETPALPAFAGPNVALPKAPAAPVAGLREEPWREEPAKEQAPRPVRTGPPQGELEFRLPPISLLDEPSEPETYMTKEELLDASARIEERLSNFGVTGRVAEVHPGPVITRFDYEPGAGITVNQIASRAEDLALGLKVSRIRLLTPVPGKAAVGLEVPNAHHSIVFIKQLLSAAEFADQRGKLVLALGKDTQGRCFYTDLARMPHLLIAGATGSGKSVCINSIILSLLYRLSPRELNMLMIDPKKLELTSYNGTPHLISPVISDAREASKSLRWVVKEMEQRYHVLAGRGVRNVDSYNEKAREEGSEILPFILVIIDELADLMCMLPTEIEEPIARLAQMARAVGIHLILATQRPSVDVITGVIKANFPTRIAFQVASKVDSRTILDMNGAESLLGNGDMLYLPPGRAEPERIHGSYVSEKDVERVVSYLREFSWMARPSVDLSEPSLTADGETEDDDELLKEATRVVITHKHGSVSLLQRRLKIGYSRAARLMDRLEETGVVGPADGSKPREVLVNESYLE
jgi:S-DNA-T family DNA segregation ATPase FtsK/SpoIIIE